MNLAIKTLLFVSPALLLSSCGSDGDSADALGALSFAITDSPVDAAEKVVVRFNGIEIKPADGDAISFDFSSPRDIDLLALQGGNAAPLISGESVPAGNYNWVRLKVSAVQDNIFDSYIQIDGIQYELRIPSGNETGLKLVSGFTVAQGGNANYTIDFDLRKSVVAPPGQAPVMMLKPALRLVNNVEVGSMTGVVDSSLIAAECEGEATGAVYVYSGSDVSPDDLDGDAGDPLTSGAVTLDEGGTYRYTIAFLAAGNYTASYSCDTDADDPESDDSLVFVGTQNASITAGATTTVSFAANS